MAKLLIKNSTLISMDKTREKVEENIDILINDEIIEKIEKNIDVTCYDDVYIIDATGKIVCPAFVNTHTHLPMSLFKDTCDTYALQDWLKKVAWPAEAKMSDFDIYYLTLMSCIEMIKTGTTTVNDLYFMTDSIIDACLVAGINMVQTRTLMDIDNDGELRFNELESLINKYKNSEQVKFSVGIHGLYTASKPYVKRAVKLAQDNNLMLHMHFCENSQEVEDIKNRYNVNTAAEVLDECFRDVHTVLAHCVNITDLDIEIMKNLDISISHCPISNLKLGSKIARVHDFLKNNIQVTLGTDGQGSGCNMDMFELMKITPLLQKGINESANILPAYDVLKMATVSGATALLMNNRGVIAKQNIADIIIIDLQNNPVTRPVNDIISDIVYNACGTNVVTTISNGKILMENRELKYLNETQIYSKCTEIIERILKH
ncbi:MAG: amidohydrolase [Clostridia bacterium]